MTKKLVYGVGTYSKGVYAASLEGKNTLEYYLWGSMLQRCYSEKTKQRFPTYYGCSASEGFKDFQYFSHWVNQQIGFGLKGWQLDKDVLYKGNKIYSEDSCVFLPLLINSTLTHIKAGCNLYPTGVHRNSRGKYSARIGGIRQKFLGSFATPEIAFEAYRVAKELRVKEVAESYRHQIDERAYHALMAWTISIDD